MDDSDRTGGDGSADSSDAVGRADTSEAVDTADTDDTVIRQPRLDDDPFGDTVIVPRRPPEDDTPEHDTVIGRVAAPVPDPATSVAAATQQGGASLQAESVPQARVPSIRIGERVFRLDRPVIVGRRPALPRIVRGPVPELVVVPSRRHEVSSSHLSIRAEGDAVVVEDLVSTNGTIVRSAGSARQRMPSGASMVVLTGTVVEIGDGNTIEILSPHLRALPPLDGPGRTAPWPAAPTDPARPDTRERS